METTWVEEEILAELDRCSFGEVAYRQLIAAPAFNEGPGLARIHTALARLEHAGKITRRRIVVIARSQ